MELPSLAFNVAHLLASGSGAARVCRLTPAGALTAGRVELVRIGAGVLVRASLEVALDAECARCLAPLVIPVPIAFDEIYEQRYEVNGGALLNPDGERDPEAFAISSSHVIDITEGVRQYGEAAAPMQPLCSAGCRGLCPGCGIDRNTGACACETAASDPRWAALASLGERKP